MGQRCRMVLFEPSPCCYAVHDPYTLLQDVAVVKTQAFGTVLVLDGAIQCTDRDEFSYQVGAVLIVQQCAMLVWIGNARH